MIRNEQAADAVPVTRLPTLDAIRRDLEWSQHAGDDKNRWIVRDPISLEYFYLSDTERSTAKLLDGTRNSQQILDEVNQHQATGKWTSQELSLFVMKLRNACLLKPMLPGYSAMLWNQHIGASRRGWVAPLLSPIAVRVPVFDPTTFLSWTGPLAYLLFHKITVLFWLAAALIAFLFSISRIIPAVADTGTLFQHFQGENAIWLIVSFAIVKSLHELGHLLACKKWKSECHDVGLLFLVFVPCLYCDTSDSWKLRNRASRAAIAAAGVYVEIILATIAAAAWMVLQPGLLQAIALNVMLICSVGTVLLNANPLLRYDGYYILADLWGVPNLADQSREVLQQSIIGFLTGVPINRNRWDVHPFGLAVYGIAALIYRLFVVTLILYVAWNLLEPIGLGLAAVAVIVLTLAGLAYATIRSAGQIFGGIIMRGPIRVFRILAVLALLAGGFCFLWTFEFTEFIRARAVATSGNLTPIFARRTGELTVLASAGDGVSTNDSLYMLDSPEKRLNVINLDGEIAILKERVPALEFLARSDPQAAATLNGLKEQLQKLENQRESVADEIRSLTVGAAHDGRIVEGNSQLVTMVAEPLDVWHLNGVWQKRHSGRTVQRGEALGWLADSDKAVLRAYVSDKDCERLETGMSVRCKWDNDPASILHGSVENISSDPIAATPHPMLGDPGFLSTRNASGAYVPMIPHYEVTITLIDAPQVSLHNAAVTVHFETGKITAPKWLWRYIQKNLRPTQ